MVIVVTLMSPDSSTAGAPENEARALTQRLMSPYCPGLLLADCRSEGARELRAEILHRLQLGEAADVVERDLVRRFGDAIRTIPAFNGLGLIAWLGPLAFGVASVWLVTHLVRRWGSVDASVVGDSDDMRSSAGMGERIQQELDALD
jgi:cytochrome c-type biogenesis protein CcmH